MTEYSHQIYFKCSYLQTLKKIHLVHVKYLNRVFEHNILIET